MTLNPLFHILIFQHDEEGEGEGGDGKQEGKTMVSWLVRRCVDSLLPVDTDSARGIYIQASVFVPMMNWR